MASFVAAAVTAVVRWATSEGVRQVALRVAATVALSAASRALAARQKAPASGIQQQRELGTTVARQIAVGRCIVAGSEVALWASGDADDNVWNTRVIAVSDWPCDLVSVIWQGQTLTWDGDLSTGWRACNQFIGKKNRARLFGRWYRGDWTQSADPELITHARYGAPWGADDRLRGVAYFALRRAYDPDAFPTGAPDASGFRFEVTGAPVFDWRDPTQTVSDVTTWKPSGNPVVLAEFGLCHARAPAQFSPGDSGPLVGPGLDWSRRFAALGDRLTAAANICDEVVDGAPRYVAGGVISGPASGWLPQLAAACAGEWVQGAAGSWLRPGHVSAPLYTIPVAALSAVDASSFQPWQAPDSGVNTVRVQYVEPGQGWQMADLTATNDAARALDKRELVAQLDLSFVASRAQANRIAVAEARLAGVREARTVVAPFWASDLERGDTVLLEDPTLPSGLAGAWWRVEAVELRAADDGARVGLSLRRVPPDAYGVAPPAPPLVDYFAPELVRALAAPAVTATIVANSGAGTSWQEIVWRIDDASLQALGLVEVAGPAVDVSEAALAAAVARALPLDRAMGATSSGALVPGWYRWRAAGRTAQGAVGAWAAWSAPVEITAGLVAGQAGSVSWDAIIGDGRPGVDVLGPDEKSRVMIPRVQSLRAASADILAQADALGVPGTPLREALERLESLLAARVDPVPWYDETSHTNVAPGPFTLMAGEAVLMVGEAELVVTGDTLTSVLADVATELEILRTTVATWAGQSIEPEFPVIEIRQGQPGHTGTRTVAHTALRGSLAVTGGTWSLVATALTGATVTVNAGTGTVSLSGVAVSGSYTLRYVHGDGVATELPVNVTWLAAAVEPLSVVIVPPQGVAGGTVGAGPGTYTTPTARAVVVGSGTAPFSYLWQRVEGASLAQLSALDPTADETAFEGGHNAANQTRSATWRCTVTDSSTPPRTGVNAIPVSTYS